MIKQVCSAGQKIIEHVEQARFFRDSKCTGVYLTCQKLREVDTSRLLDIMLAESMLHIPAAVFAYIQEGSSICLHTERKKNGTQAGLIKPWPSAGESGRRCYAPSVEDKHSNMNLLHVGKSSIRCSPPLSIICLHLLVSACLLFSPSMAANLLRGDAGNICRSKVLVQVTRYQPAGITE